MDLTAAVREGFGIPLIGVQPTGLGADARASLWRGVTADGSTYAVKTSSAVQPGLAVADFLARQGVAGVPAALHTRSGGLVLGAVHATAHAEPLVGAGALLPVDRHDPTAEVKRARVFPEQLVRGMAAAPDDAVIDELVALWARSGEDVLAVAELAEGTARSGAWSGAAGVICHADPHHGNLVLDGDGGDVWPIAADDERSFFDGYTPASGGVTRSDLETDRLTYYRSVRALTDFLDFADDALDREISMGERADALRIASGALAPAGIVPLALSEAAAGH